MLGTIGFSQAFWMIVVFPPLHRKLGTVRLVRLCAVALPTRFVIMPVTLLFMRRHADEAAFWTCALCILVFSSGISTISSSTSSIFSSLWITDESKSCRSTPPKRSLSVAPRVGHTERHCALPHVGYSRRQPCNIQHDLRYRCARAYTIREPDMDPVNKSGSYIEIYVVREVDTRECEGER
jgi:hypothetical protein